jgi:hypothetical protein
VQIGAEFALWEGLKARPIQCDRLFDVTVEG